MKLHRLIIAAAAGLALVAPVASAKTSVRNAQKICAAAAKDLDNVKSVRATDDGQRFTNASAEVPLRITHEDGSRAKMICMLDRETGEVTSLEAAEE